MQAGRLIVKPDELPDDGVHLSIAGVGGPDRHRRASGQHADNA